MSEELDIEELKSNEFIIEHELDLNITLDYQIYLIEKLLEFDERFPEAYKIKNSAIDAAKTAFAQIATIQKAITKKLQNGEDANT